MKYSQALSYACQEGSMLRNLSPASAGTVSHKFCICKIIQTGNNIIKHIKLSKMLLSMIINEMVKCSLLKDKPQIHSLGNMDQYRFQTTCTIKTPGSIWVLGLDGITGLKRSMTQVTKNGTLLTHCQQPKNLAEETIS